MALSAAILFSSKGLVAKWIYAYSVSPAQLLSLRLLFAAPWYLLILLYLYQRQIRVRKSLLTYKAFLKASGMGFLGYYLSSLLDFTGIRYLSTGMERMILFLYPTFVVIGNRFFFKERLPMRVWWSLLLSYIGVGLAYMGDADFDRSTGWLGALLVMSAALVFSVYMLLSQKLVKELGSEMFTAYAMLGAALFMNLHFMWIEGGKWGHLPMPVLGYTAFMGFFQTVIPSLLMMKAVEWIGASRSAVIAGSGPIITLVLGIIFLGESLGVLEGVGVALTLWGAWGLKENKKSKKES